MRKARRERRAQRQLEDQVKKTPCWRCGEPCGGSEGKWFPMGDAVVEIDYADGSYSGTYRLPLCDRCLMSPHQDGLERIDV
jgi:hypothetical protein